MLAEQPPVAGQQAARSTRRAIGDLRAGLGQRELWAHLGWQDIKQRYRRSVLGPLWITLATAVTAAAMGLLYSQLFHQDVSTFLPHVTLGLIFWNFIQQSILEGSVVFTSNDGLIKQVPAPLSVHVYRLVWRQLIIFTHNIVIYLVIMAIYPQPVDATILLIIPGLTIFMINAVWASIVFGILCTRLRDLSQLLTTAVLLVFYLTPVIWTTHDIHGNRHSTRLRLVEINPMFHYLEITRGPLTGQHVQAYHWWIVLGCTTLGCTAAVLVLRNYRSRVAYWV